MLKTDTPRIVWLASWRGHSGYVYSNRAVPGWIHEGGNEVKWHVIEGAEHLRLGHEVRRNTTPSRKLRKPTRDTKGNV